MNFGFSISLRSIKGALQLSLALAALAFPATAGKTTGISPAPRDSDGRFQNYLGATAMPDKWVTWPFYLRRSLTLLRGRAGALERRKDSNKILAALNMKGQDFAFWIGHSTLLVRLGDVTFLTDPIWSQYAGPGGILGARRYVPPAISIEELPELDFVLISHNHYDHLDVPTLRKIATQQNGLRVFTPLANGDTLNGLEHVRLHELDWGERTPHRNAILTCLPAQHWSRRGLNDMRLSLWSSWAVSVGNRHFFFGGDTGSFPELTLVGDSLGPFDLVALPIGAYEPAAMMRPYHLTPEEAIYAAEQLRALRVVAIHFGTFDLSDEPLDEPPQRFLSAGKDAGWSSDKLWLLQIGEGRPF